MSFRSACNTCHGVCYRWPRASPLNTKVFELPFPHLRSENIKSHLKGLWRVWTWIMHEGHEPCLTHSSSARVTAARTTRGEKSFLHSTESYSGPHRLQGPKVCLQVKGGVKTLGEPERRKQGQNWVLGGEAEGVWRRLGWGKVVWVGS